MASWNIPALLNAIKHDIEGLGSLLRSLAIGDPSAGNTDLPAQSKRMQEGTDGWEWQMFNGNVWNRMAKWNINAAQVDGFDASAGTTANTIPVRDKNGDLPGNVLGNAATATKAKKLSATNPVELGGTGATTPQQARQNLGTPPTEHSSSGAEFGLGTSVKHGHTKLSDATDSSSDTSGGTAATPKAVKTAKAEAITAAGEALEAFAEGQAAKDAAQDAAIAAAQSSADAAQSTANSALEKATNITVPVTSVNGQTGAVTVGTVRTVNGVSADAAGNVAISVPATPKAYVTATGTSGNYWYRKYSDGWIEQGGVSGSTTITFPTAFSTTTYVIVANDNFDAGSGDVTWSWYNVHTKTTTSAKKDSVNTTSWYAAGY